MPTRFARRTAPALLAYALQTYALLAYALLAYALPASIAHAAPHIPASGGTVVERLARRADPVQRELASLRAQLAANPRDLALATRSAQRYITVARQETDPRYFGYAQAALAPWWQMAAPPPEVRLLRAILLQSTHHFAEALRDLDAIVAADPANPQAWLTRAIVQTVRGDYQGASASCARLSSLSTELVTVTCVANVGSMTGHLAKSEAVLDTTLRRNQDADAGMQAWVLTLLAEMAQRRGDARAADARFRRALAFDARDSYLLGAYADFLLEQGRAPEVIALLREHTRIDGLLLRHALALRQVASGGDALRSADAELKARFEAAMRRGDTVHQREQARYELHIRGDARAALALAQQNWAVQKESADMIVLLEAAARAGDRAAAAAVIDWAARHALEDVAVARLVRQIGAGT
jgi:Tfp pilus assembly protein PilF